MWRYCFGIPQHKGRRADSLALVVLLVLGSQRKTAEGACLQTGHISLWGHVRWVWSRVCILKFVVTAAVLVVTKFILEFIHYTDNILFSFQSVEEFNQVKEDMKQSFDRYSLPLK